MAVTMDRSFPPARGRWSAFLLAAAWPLFAGATLSDYAYTSSHEIQWSNFAAWLIAGGLVFVGVSLVCDVVALFRKSGRNGRAMAGFVLVLAIFVVGVVNALVHARDAWAVMPTGMLLSLAVLVLATLATWLAFSEWRAGDQP